MKQINNNTKLHTKPKRTYQCFSLAYNPARAGKNDHSATIDISAVSKGIYFAEIFTEGSAGSPTIVRKKIIKE